MTSSESSADAGAKPPTDPAAVVDALEERVFAGKEGLLQASEHKQPAPDAEDPGAEPPV